MKHRLHKASTPWPPPASPFPSPPSAAKRLHLVATLQLPLLRSSLDDGGHAGLCVRVGHGKQRLVEMGIRQRVRCAQTSKWAKQIRPMDSLEPHAPRSEGLALGIDLVPVRPVINPLRADNGHLTLL